MYGSIANFMNWQVFFSTFLLIFLAELGDKTQLAVMAQSAGSTGRGTVFIAGSLALILSTAVGVLAGGLLRKFVPDLTVIRVCGGIMFLVFGTVMLVDVVRRKSDNPTVEDHATPNDWMSRHVIQHAAVFEEAAALHYRELAAKEKDQRKRNLYEWLAAEELSHMDAMKAGLLVAGAEQHIHMTEAMVDDMPPFKDMVMNCAGGDNDSTVELQHAIAAEETQVRFYEALAEHCKISRLKETFYALARAEELHAQKLRAVLDGGCYGRLD